MIPRPWTARKVRKRLLPPALRAEEDLVEDQGIDPVQNVQDELLLQPEHLGQGAHELLMGFESKEGIGPHRRPPGDHRGNGSAPDSQCREWADAEEPCHFADFIKRCIFILPSEASRG